MLTASAPPGVAGRIAALCGDGLQQQDLYGAEGSQLYAVLSRGDRQEIPEVLRILRGAPGPVLDLACGSGRLTFPLLARGYRVTALDLSPWMLERLAAEAARPRWRTAAARLELVEADMGDFDLGRRFGAVVLSATSVSLLDATARRALFRAVGRQLAPDGRFVFSTLEFDPGQAPRGGVAEDSRTFALPADSGGGAVVTLFEYLDRTRSVRWISLLRTTVGRAAPARVDLFTSRVNILTISVLTAELAEAGLRVAATHPVGAVPGEPPDRAVCLLECRHARAES